MHQKNLTKNSGFALIISLSLMAFVLLLLLSITTLVQVEQKGAAISKAQLEAKQNALLALNQALGTLQAEMGPDQRISANADIFDDSGTLTNDNSMSVAHPYLVGAWDTSGDYEADTVAERIAKKWAPTGSTSTIDYNARVTGGFRRWLISSDRVLDRTDSTLDPTDLNFATETYFRSGNSGNRFKALGSGTLQPNTAGSLSTSLAKKEIWAPLQDISSGSGTTNARIGWVVLDESVKARINQSHQLANNTSPTNTEAILAWDNPGNVGIEAMGSSDEFSGFDRSSPDSGKVSSFASASMYMNDASNGSVAADEFGPYFHDLSLYSKGVMADVVNGGLKRDLSTLAEEQPSDYMDRFLYSDTNTGHGSNPKADPRWSAILDYIGIYKDNTRLKAGTAGGPPVALMNTTDWSGDPSNREDIDLPFPAPETYRLAPAVGQFEFYFSFLALVPHTPNFLTNDADPAIAPLYRGSDTRMLHLCLAPVITLYNPYSVPIEYGEMWVVFRDIPLGMRLSRKDHVSGTEVRMTDEFIPFAAMNSKGGNNVKFAADGSQRFNMKLTTGDRRRRTTTLAPGESIVYSPNYDGSKAVGDLDNWTSEENGKIEATPGYSEGVGLYFDAFVPDAKRNSESIQLMGNSLSGTASNPTFNMWYVFINENDTIKVELGHADGTQNPERKGPDSSSLERNGTFSIELFSEDPNMADNTSDGSDSANMIGRYTFDYNTGFSKGTSDTARKDLLDAGRPLDQDLEMSAVEELTYARIDTPNVDRFSATVSQVIPYTIGALRLGGKVTDRTSGKPYQPAVAAAFTNTSVLSGHFDVGEESSAFTSYDLSIIADGQGEMGPTIDSDNRGRFFSGYDTIDGTQYGTLFELPVTPLQSIGSLQHANIAASGYQPQVSHVVGNSLAHPLIESIGALKPNAQSKAGSPVGFFDHSYLANTSLWDSYYFSTLTDQRSIMDNSGDDFSTTVTNFFANEPLPNPTFKYHIPAGSSIASATAELSSGSTAQTEAYLKAAAYQTLDGSFNINSTSVDAWKAILATTNIANSLVKQPYYYNPESTSTPIAFTTNSAALGAVYSRFRIPNYNQSLEASLGNYGSAGNLPTAEDFAIWQGYRQLDETILDRLAEDIVDQIRHRGPFLSVAEFVNRRLGPESDSRTQMGAIDSAIAANNTINNPLTNAAGEDISGDIKTHIESNDFSMIENSIAVSGNTARGVTSHLSQADILQQIGSRLSARSDTFVIRAYGEVVDPFTGDISAKSLCEAVVQRIPDYVDSAQEPYFDTDKTTLAPDGLSETNERFGRKFKIVQLNWLDPSDV